MSATLRKSTIRMRRQRREKRQKLREQLTQASAAERAAIEAKLLKTYRLVTARRQAAGQSGSRPTSR